VVLLGDACHAVVPFYGQGMNAAFEDALVLDECLRDWPDDTGRAFGEYDRIRRPHVDVLADLALRNFVEMRDHTGSKRFLLKKKKEKLLNKLFPNWYLPLYSMATFTRIPYGEAVARARRQDRVVTVVAGIGLLIAVSLIIGWVV
jgi:kynurenine 3-monooxygenase